MNRVEWVENLRVIATISVIFIHVCAPGVSAFGTIPASDWNIYNFFDGLTRFCVPIFVMITGTFLLNKDYTIRDLFKSKLTKIIIPFLFFSCIYIVYSYDYTKILYDFDIVDFVRHTVGRFIYGGFYHLWYIYMLIGLYIITPVIRVYVKNADKNNMKYFLIAWFIFNSIINYPSVAYLPNFQISLFSNFTGYFILGYYLSKYPITSVKTGWILFLTGSLITIAGPALYAVKYNSFNEMFYSYTSLNVMLQSIGVYSIVFKSTIKNRAIATARDLISKHSYNIYLVHALILAIIIKRGLTWYHIHPVAGIAISIAICLTASILISIILKNIPYVKRYL